jgi:glycerate 2-kinase
MFGSIGLNSFINTHSARPNKTRTKMAHTINTLISPNAFKGSLTAIAAANAIRQGLAESASDNVQFHCVLAPAADGGDGTLETLVGGTGGTMHTAEVKGPLGDRVKARWGRLGGSQSDTAVIEMAEASGLRLLPRVRYNPQIASTYGTGQLMLAANEAGCKRLLVGIGGSATNDCGAGMASALGARFLDEYGQELPPCGESLARLASIDMSGWCLPKEVRVEVACDVNNPLTGPNGASAVYSPQKGASPEMAAFLDSALHRCAAVMRRDLGADVEHTPGAGAAGGLGGGLLAFCGASLRPGADLVLDAVGFDAQLQECSLVITGEGLLDSQTANGKILQAVAERSLAAGKPCFALVGASAEGAEALMRAYGITGAFSICPGPTSLDFAVENAEKLLRDAARRFGWLFIAGFAAGISASQ